ncbi:TadE/TadG family type IV pilus assembly protein [Qipengyuania sp. JC766]|uniref:TadE/TadG family type IV pilus assembly protein n=1 Tax=Qipengyuania sp. JC766 TaxID=3232139 RepID=UPI0034592807
MARRKSCDRSVARDESGAALMEFGIVAPVFIMMLMGLFDYGQLTYGQSVLNGAVQEAARASALETGDTAEADAMVREQVQKILPGADVRASRVSYYDFADLERPEQWNDANNNGDCDNGEAYTDENRNGQWDEDVGVSNNGNANDVVIYSVTVSYDAPFAVPLLPYSDDRTIEASAIKKNQPFADQQGYGSTSGTCS